MLQRLVGKVEGYNDMAIVLYVMLQEMSYIIES